MMVLVGCCIVGAVLGSLQNGAAAKTKVDFVTSLVRTILSPVSSPLAQAGKGTGTFLGNIFSVNRVVAENHRLKEQAAVFALYATTVEEKDRTIEQLRTLMGLGSVKGKDRVAANVTGLSINENRLSLDVGSNQGVSAGCPVESAQGLVGTVEDVEPTRSQVLLLTSAGLQQSAHGKASLIGGVDVSRNPPQIGLLRGENATTVSLTFLDPKAPIQIGDMIVTSGISEKIPAGLVIGKVIQVESNEVYGYLKARVDPAYSVGNLDVVYVLK